MSAQREQNRNLEVLRPLPPDWRSSQKPV